MKIPEGVSIKSGIYFLACREFLNRLPSLFIGTQRDNIISDDSCIRLFNQKISEFFEQSSGTNSMKKAAISFGNRLHAEAFDIRDFNEQAANILEDVVGAVYDNAENFNFLSELESFHTKGREIAINFFKASPWANIEQISKRVCCIDFRYQDVKYGVFDETPFRTCITHKNPHHHLVPMWFQKMGDGQPDFIVINFTYEHNFHSFLAYLFWFIHEYTAHVFSNDYYGNEIYNDGWLLYAADRFLKSKKMLDNTNINPYQIRVFVNHLQKDLLRSAQRGCGIAYNVANLPLTDSEKFDRITYELAAFTPQLKERTLWPTDFINALDEQYMMSRERLFHKIEASDSIRDLMNALLL